MPNEVDIDELDASDLGDILSGIKEATVKVKNVAAARKELTSLLESTNQILTADDEGNFVLNDKPKAKGKVKVKAKAAEPEPEPEEAEEEVEEEAEEEVEEEAEAETEEEVVEEPAPKKVAKKAAAPVKKSVVVKKPQASEDEEEVAAAPKAKRAPPPREPTLKPDQTIKVLNAEAKFQEGSGRAKKWALVQKCKTVGEFIEKAQKAELATPSGYLGHCIKQGYIRVT